MLVNYVGAYYNRGKLYIALKTGRKRKAFTLDYREKPGYDCLVAQIEMDVQFMKDVVDIFCRDLKSVRKSGGSE